MNTSIQQGCIKLIKNDITDIYHVTEGSSGVMSAVLSSSMRLITVSVYGQFHMHILCAFEGLIVMFYLECAGWLVTSSCLCSSVTLSR